MIDRRINVRGIIYKDGKILGQILKPGVDGIKHDYWCTPGGGLDANESLIDGLTREIIEETGIAPRIGKLLFIQQFQDNDKTREDEQLEFFFNIENSDDFRTINLATTSHGPIEIQQVDFIDPKSQNILPKFLQTIDIKDYIENDKPVFIYSELPKINS